MLRQKFKAKPVYHDGMRFASIKEGKRYLELKALQLAGEVKFFKDKRRGIYREESSTYWIFRYVGQTGKIRMRIQKALKHRCI